MKTVIIILVLIILGLGGYWYVTNYSSAEKAEPVGGKTDSETPLSTEETLVYEGTVPAASSPGIKTTLSLTNRGDGLGGAFTLTEDFIDEDDGLFESSGQWELKTGVIKDAPAASVYVLTSEDDPNFVTRYYEIIDEHTIRQLTPEATRVESDLPYNLTLQ